MKHKISIIVAALLIFVLALGITLYPLISNYVNQKYASTIYTKYEEMIQNVDETELQEARSLAQSYNQALAPVSSYDKEGISEASHNYDSLLNLGGNGIMGYIEIPCIQVNLPIYHGTDTETLERGVGHLLGSSLPVGGSSTHAVLSGHSGMAGQKMFTDLLQMKTGDIFYGVDYAITKDKSQVPPRYLIFFKARDSDALTAAFKEFSAETARKAERPSMLALLAKMKVLAASLPKKVHEKKQEREL